MTRTIVQYETHIGNKDYKVHQIVQYHFSGDSVELVSVDGWDSNGRAWTREQDCGFNYDQKSLTPEKLLALVENSKVA